jgi:hypothetical protein
VVVVSDDVSGRRDVEPPRSRPPAPRPVIPSSPPSRQGTKPKTESFFFLKPESHLCFFLGVFVPWWFSLIP